VDGKEKLSPNCNKHWMWEGMETEERLVNQFFLMENKEVEGGEVRVLVKDEGFIEISKAVPWWDEGIDKENFLLLGEEGVCDVMTLGERQ